MNKTIKILFCILLVILVIIALSLFHKAGKKEENQNTKIVTSFYPIYLIASNLTENAKNVELVNLAQNNVGCLHDYTLSATDMRKMENANIFIQNGLGLENFMDKIIEANKDLKVINSSKQINSAENPHVWTSIQNYISQVQVVAEELSIYDEQNSSIYKENCEKYLANLNNLKEKYEEELNNLKNKKAICLNEAILSLLTSMQMQVTNIETNHEESTLSADTIKNTINKMRAENIKAIFIGSEDSAQNAEILANETGATIYKLETLLTGEFNKDEYINKMTKNLEILKQVN